MKNIFSTAAWLLTLFLLFSTGCFRGGDSGEQSSARNIRIGFSLDSVVVERWTKDQREFALHARSLGAEVIQRNAVADAQQQVADINELIDLGVDSLVVVPNDSSALTEVLNRARSLGIPVVAYDRLILDAPIQAYVSFDNTQVGRLLAEGALEHTGDGGRYLLINGGASDNNSRLIRQGIMETLEPYMSRGQVELAGEISPADWYTFLIEDELEAYLQDESINAVIAANDQFADAAIQILSRYRRAGEVVVVGQDADLIACQRIVEGIQHRTIYKSIRLIAKTAAETAYHLAIGEQLRSSRSIFNGAADIPAIILQPVAVELGNLEETVIADGFHRREDVFRSSQEE